MNRLPIEDECDPGQEFARRQFSSDLLQLLVSYNHLWRHRNVNRAIAASMQSVAQLHPAVNADCIRALIDSLRDGVVLAFPADRTPRP